MLYYNRIDLKELMLLKAITVKNALSVIIRYWIFIQNFGCSGCHDVKMLLSILLLSMSKALTIAVLLMTLPNLKQLFC